MAHPRAFPPSVARPHGAGGPDALPPARLADLARCLHESDTGHIPALIRIIPDRAGPVVVLRVVLDDDPVDALIGAVAPADTLAVGLCAPAHGHRLERRRPPTAGRVVHLVDVRGTSVTVVPGAGPADPVVGPTGTPLIGRVPEACRRQLGLPTPPAPPIEISTIVDLWLARAAMAAMHGDDVGWSDVLSMLPSGPPRAPTPADAAAALHQAVAHWSWEQVRGRVARGATHLVAGCADATAAAWMDTGMFGRWVVGELPPSGVLLEVLDALTSPATVERIRAARRLAGNAGSR